MIRRYLHGWWMWLRALYMCRTKRHGAGASSWTDAVRMAACYRWIVDGQMRGGVPPWFIRQGKREEERQKRINEAITAALQAFWGNVPEQPGMSAGHRRMRAAIKAYEKAMEA